LAYGEDPKPSKSARERAEELSAIWEAFPGFSYGELRGLSYRDRALWGRLAAIKLARTRARQADNRLVVFDACAYAMTAKPEDAKALKGPYVAEANAAREHLIRLIEEDDPDFAYERRAAEKAKYATSRRALRSAVGG